MVRRGLSRSGRMHSTAFRSVAKSEAAEKAPRYRFGISKRDVEGAKKTTFQFTVVLQLDTKERCRLKIVEIVFAEDQQNTSVGLRSSRRCRNTR